MEDMTKPISDVLAEADFGPQLLTQELDTSSIQHECKYRKSCIAEGWLF